VLGTCRGPGSCGFLAIGVLSPPGVYEVLGDARTDPVPGPKGGGNTNNNPTAVLENCALTVFVIPAA
jgi:hypothetical protein